MEKSLFTFSEFADCLGVSRQAIYKSTKSGLIPFLNENGTNKIDINDSLVKDYILSVQDKTGQTFNQEKAEKIKHIASKVSKKPKKEKTVKVIPENQEDFSDIPPDTLEALENGTLTVGQALRLPTNTLKKLKTYEDVKKVKVEAEKKRGELIDREIVAKLIGRLKNIHQNQFLISKAKIAANISKIFGFTDPGMTTKIEEKLDDEFYKVLNNIISEFDKFLEAINYKDNAENKK